MFNAAADQPVPPPPPLPSCVPPCSAGELSAEELESIMTIVANPRAYKIPDWFLNRQKDVKDGRYSQARQRWGCGGGPAGLRGMLCSWQPAASVCVCAACWPKPPGASGQQWNSGGYSQAQAKMRWHLERGRDGWGGGAAAHGSGGATAGRSVRMHCASEHTPGSAAQRAMTCHDHSWRSPA